MIDKNAKTGTDNYRHKKIPNTFYEHKIMGIKKENRKENSRESRQD